MMSPDPLISITITNGEDIVIIRICNVCME